MPHRADTPELAKACDMLRAIYWREYGRGWREATANIKRILEQQELPEPVRKFDETVGGEQAVLDDMPKIGHG